MGNWKQYLYDRGLSDFDIESWGLFYRDGRIVFPIFDRMGNHLGETARTITNTLPKYVNSSAVEGFEKSSALYGIEKAWQRIYEKESIIIVEGQFDVISCHRVGMNNAVALSGTALSRKQIEEILYNENLKTIYLFLDNDDAGNKATAKIIQMLWQYFKGDIIVMMGLEKGDDPDSILRNNEKIQLVPQEKYLIWYYEPLPTTELFQTLLGLYVQMPNQVKEKFLKIIKQKLDIEERYFNYAAKQIARTSAKDSD